jgi:superfamily II DNA or RNA helicase
MGRTFSGTARSVAYIAADGKCQLCGAELGPDWEADHVTPYSKGGATDVTNVQALCRTCNRAKSDKNDGLRAWQAAARADFDKGAGDFLCVATPGAGKTRFATACARKMLDAGEVHRVIVIVPTEPLKVQWSDAAHRYDGLDLSYRWRPGNGPVTAQHGLVATYQAVASNSAAFRHLMKVSTIVIFDEIHHAGDRDENGRALPWGEALEEAFGPATRRLSLSGTPFRTDNRKIPFVRYRQEGNVQICDPDFIYGYASALKDGVVRRLVFPTFRGTVELLGSAQAFEMSFDDDLDERGQDIRLNAAVQSQWKDEVLRNAHSLLCDLRREDPNAAGLVLAKDQRHAKEIAKDIHRITGRSPAVAISTAGDEEGKAVIEEFRDSAAEWIVAVKMLSEGVDVPRLRVLAYLTTIKTELFFRQACGRVVRANGTETDAYVFIPDDPRIRAAAENHAREVNQAIVEMEMREMRESQERDRAQGSLLTPFGGQAIAGDTIYQGDAFAPEMMRLAEEYKRQAQSGLSVPEFARLLQQWGVVAGGGADAPQGPATPSPQRQIDVLRGRLSNMARRLAIARQMPGERAPYSNVEAEINRYMGVQTRNHATVYELQRGVSYVQRLLTGGSRG